MDIAILHMLAAWVFYGILCVWGVLFIYTHFRVLYIRDGEFVIIESYMTGKARVHEKGGYVMLPLWEYFKTFSPGRSVFNVRVNDERRWNIYRFSKYPMRFEVEGWGIYGYDKMIKMIMTLTIKENPLQFLCYTYADNPFGRLFDCIQKEGYGTTVPWINSADFHKKFDDMFDRMGIAVDVYFDKQ